MLGLGGGFAFVLLIASEKLKVEVDPKVEQIHKALPNLDCGACGFAGCGQYAKAVLKDPGLLGKCAPGGRATSGKIAKILNLHVSESGPAKRPVVHCRAHTDDKTIYAKYHGIQSCNISGKIFEVELMPDAFVPWAAMSMPVGAFITLGLLLGLVNAVTGKKA